MAVDFPRGTAPLLALDSSSDWCSVALLASDALDSVSERAGHAHSRRLLAMVDSLLAPRGLGLASLGGIAYGCGPGSFTGLRIACGIAQGLGFAHGTPLLPIGTLAAIAAAASALAQQPEQVAVVTDARMDEAYVAVYRAVPGAAPQQELGPRLVAPGALAEVLGARLSPGFVAAGEGWGRFAGQLAGLASQARRVWADGYSRADAVARLGVLALTAGSAVAPEQGGLAYVRDKVALDVDEQARLREARRLAAAGGSV